VKVCEIRGGKKTDTFVLSVHNSMKSTYTFYRHKNYVVQIPIIKISGFGYSLVVQQSCAACFKEYILE
jgi:hypothetical protein